MSTAAIFGLRALQRGTTAAYVDWANFMLEAGHDSRNLRILAGLGSFTSSFEAQDHFTNALVELGIKEPDKERAVRDYAVYLAERIIDGSLAYRAGVKIIADLCISSNYPRYLSKWYELEDDMWDLDYGETPWFHHELTLKNAQKIVEKEAREFLETLKGN